MPDVVAPPVPAAFPVVGVGASAGGLDAFLQLLQCLPVDTGLAFVLIQHLDRNHPSLLSSALAKATKMPVQQAEHGTRVEPNHVYVIAPNTCIAMKDEQLVLSPRNADPTLHLPVDFFFRSLASELGSRAIGVVLSGAASDGTAGLRAIRAEGGITFAQDPRTAKYSSMPQTAVEADVVDYCMEIPQLAQELVRLSRHPYVHHAEPGSTYESDESVRDEIFERVRSAIGVDFREFKASTAARRLARRLALRRVGDLRAYLKLLDAEPEEIRALFEDMLIHVTSFFRNPEAFDSLSARVFPEILKHKPAGSAVRMWVAGCSTGEEVYSLAIAWLEFSAQSPSPHSIQIFGSDLSEGAIHKARLGAYSEGAVAGVNPERLARYFTKTDAGYQIEKTVRDLCVFVRHDLVRDPPFSKLDLVSCRNVLIYFDDELQKRILPTLHYCLNQPGFLLLGRSESITSFTQLFSAVDKANKIFARSSAASSLRFAPRTHLEPPMELSLGRGRGAYLAHSAVLVKHLDRLLLTRYCPAGVLVNDSLDVLLFRGHTGAYLQAAPGEPQSNLISMARSGLVSVLRESVAHAKRDMTVVRAPDVEVDQDGTIKLCDVVVIPFSGLPENKEPLFIVLFEEPQSGVSAMQRERPAPDATRSDSEEQRRSARLEHELSSTKEYLHTLVEEHGRASEELGTSNEELISGNEELQSMNEELETAKEELQSINEELTTLNDELQSRNQEVTQSNSDLLNFSLTVDIPILTLDLTRRIRRCTPKACVVLNVLPQDVGRSIDEIRLNVDVPDLTLRIDSVLETGAVDETEVQDKTGRWYRMSIRPHTATDLSTDGVILSFVDINDLKQLVAEAQLARSEAERANSAKDDFLATLSHELRTPLSSMLLNAQRLRAGHVVEPADLQRAGEALERATWMQMKLIDDLLDVSRIVAGKLTLECRAVDLCGAVQAALDSVAPMVTAKALVLRVSLDPKLELIWADRVRVQQVVANLLTNAIKFTPRGGQVSVAVDMAAGFARLRVADTGIGIEADFLPQVFARFSQRDTSITRKYGGLGLGLALVRHLVELQGGQVRAQSGGAGHGATFSVTFPLMVAVDQSTEIETHATTVASAGHALDRPGKTHCYDALAGLRVLFVDDDLRTREAVCEVLELTGARVELAASVAEGMVAIDSFQPQVILCDIAMPGEDGYTFIRKLRAREAIAHAVRVPALALTALAAEEDRKRALAAGFQLHMAKPIDIDRLRESVLELARLATAARSEPPPAALA